MEMWVIGRALCSWAVPRALVVRVSRGVRVRANGCV